VRRTLVVAIFLVFSAAPSLGAQNVLQDQVMSRRMFLLGKDVARESQGFDYLKENFIMGALIHQSQQEDAEAVKLCRKGLRMFPDDPNLQVELAESLSHLEKYQDAEALFGQVLSSPYWNNLSLLAQETALQTYRDQLLVQRRRLEAMMIEQRLARLQEKINNK
jgi:tetratricopeptide (TPR) repeat protein